MLKQQAMFCFAARKHVSLRHVELSWLLCNFSSNDHSNAGEVYENLRFP
jgi:hypothetical protein